MDFIWHFWEILGTFMLNIAQSCLKSPLSTKEWQKYPIGSNLGTVWTFWAYFGNFGVLKGDLRQLWALLSLKVPKITDKCQKKVKNGKMRKSMFAH